MSATLDGSIRAVEAPERKNAYKKEVSQEEVWPERWPIV